MGEDAERGSAHDAADSEARDAGQAKEDVDVPWFINVMLALSMIAVGYCLRGYTEPACQSQAPETPMPASVQASYCVLTQGDKDDDSIAWKLVYVYSPDPSAKVEK